MEKVAYKNNTGGMEFEAGLSITGKVFVVAVLPIVVGAIYAFALLLSVIKLGPFFSVSLVIAGLASFIVYLLLKQRVMQDALDDLHKVQELLPVLRELSNRAVTRKELTRVQSQISGLHFLLGPH